MPLSPSGAVVPEVSSGAAAPALVVAGLSWHIDGARILNDVTLSAAPGEFVAVIGPNGAGKTSLFNLITGTHRPDAGRVELLGRDVTALPVHRRARLGLGRSFQSSAVFPSLSVRENIRLAVHARMRRDRARPPAAAVTRAAEEYLERVRLTERTQADAAVLSHGDKRKVEIALVLAGAALGDPAGRADGRGRPGRDPAAAGGHQHLVR
ncbi:hypothetical protein GCM10009838_75620 [Catenulispora subtropica]|uniref:ABC transporter domain-containing protein n=1 Tax=Catenulispora subtropica TaxID=450798 RepID=A0ABN2T7B0_9ACTN